MVEEIKNKIEDEVSKPKSYDEKPRSGVKQGFWLFIIFLVGGVIFWVIGQKIFSLELVLIGLGLWGIISMITVVEREVQSKRARSCLKSLGMLIFIFMVLTVGYLINNVVNNIGSFFK